MYDGIVRGGSERYPLSKTQRTSICIEVVEEQVLHAQINEQLSHDLIVAPKLQIPPIYYEPTILQARHSITPLPHIGGSFAYLSLQ